MNIAALQARLDHFAEERDWQRLHTPKNLATALMVEAAGLAEVFKWMTPEESIEAHTEPESKQCTGEAIADVLVRLLQLARHTRVDVEQTVEDKLARDARNYPAKTTAAATTSVAPAPDTHVLLDYENVQPDEAELRAMVPAATRLWVFHGPHQKHVEQRFTSFGTGMTAVPISRTGKNALDFHLSFYMGYIASRDQQSRIVVVANDKGYGPMLEHAKTLGFAVCQQDYKPAPGRVPESPSTADAPVAAAKPAVTKEAAKKALVRQPAAKQAASPKPAVARKAAAKQAAAKKAPAKKKSAAKAQAPAAKKAVKAVPPVQGTTTASAADRSGASRIAPDSPSVLRKLTDSLRKMGETRPAKQAPLRRVLKTLLGPPAASEQAIGIALGNLIARTVVAVGATGDVTYPQFDKK